MTPVRRSHCGTLMWPSSFLPSWPLAATVGTDICRSCQVPSPAPPTTRSGDARLSPFSQRDRQPDGGAVIAVARSSALVSRLRTQPVGRSIPSIVTTSVSPCHRTVSSRSPFAGVRRSVIHTRSTWTSLVHLETDGSGRSPMVRIELLAVESLAAARTSSKCGHSSRLMNRSS